MLHFFNNLSILMFVFDQFFVYSPIKKETAKKKTVCSFSENEDTLRKTECSTVFKV